MSDSAATSRSSLVFTVALNGYSGAYADCISSQRRYADRIEASYAAATRPFRVQPALAAWLKIPLLLGALRAGYERVAFIDADARVQERAPDFGSAVTPGGVHMAVGRSGRLNSGVILCDRGGNSIDFLEQLMASATEPVPEADRASLKYENGNVIYVARTSGLVSDLPLAWNNTFDSALDDYVRHYTGPLRAEYKRGRAAQLMFSARKRMVTKPTKQPERREEEFTRALAQLTSRCQGQYPALTGR